MSTIHSTSSSHIPEQRALPRMLSVTNSRDLVDIAIREIKQIEHDLHKLSQMIERSPLMTTSRMTVKLLTQSPTSCMTKTGMISNVIAAVGALARSPTMMIGGLLISSTVIFVNYEEERQRELMRKLIDELKETNVSLVTSNRTLRQEIECLKDSISQLRIENEHLMLQNRRLEDNLTELQRKIDALSDHVQHLKMYNDIFEGHLGSVKSLLDILTKHHSHAMATSTVAKEVKEELANIQTESSEFSSFFRQTKSMIENKQEQVSGQIDVLKVSIENLLHQIEGLSAVNGIANIKEHLVVSLNGLKQFQEGLVINQGHLQMVSERCEAQHLRLQMSQRRCEGLLLAFSRNIVVNDD